MYMTNKNGFGFLLTTVFFSQFPIREETITLLVGGVVRPKPGINILFHFYVPKGQNTIYSNNCSKP